MLPDSDDIRSLQTARVEAAIASWLAAAERGQTPDPEEFIARHSEFAAELREFFADHARMQGLAGDFSPSGRLGSKADSISPGEASTLIPEVVSPADAPTLPPCEPGAARAEAGSIFLETKVRYFGDYELLEEIARGGMGVVYKARQINLNRLVALKMILAGQLASPDDVKRFYTEAEAAAQLDHPGIVPIFEVGQHEGQHFFSMGFVEGQSLAGRVAAGPLPPREAAQLVAEVAEAAQYAHDKGVIHRDLKPGNILLDQQGKPRVTDFGLAKLTESGSDLTGTGQILGTPSYMPPEQASGKTDRIGPLADVYSLGAILYCLLTGRPPFQAASPMDTLLQVLDQEPLAPRQLNRNVPRDLDTIALKCLEKNSGRRYRSARDLAADLQRFLDDEPILARPMGALGRFRRWTKEMPIASGCLISLGGLLGLGAGIACLAGALMSFGKIGFDTFNDRTKPGITFSLPPDGAQKTPVFRLVPGTLNLLVLRMHIRSKSFEMYDPNNSAPGQGPPFEPNGQLPETPGGNKKSAKVPRIHYNFPIKYTVLDKAGKTLEEGSTRADWNSLTLQENAQVTPEKDLATVIGISDLCKIRAPALGQVQAQVEVGPDEIYHAQADTFEVRVFENVHDNERFTLAGGSLCIISPVVLIAGFILVIYGPFLIATRERPKRR
jgi:serine/threonine protein kinase